MKKELVVFDFDKTLTKKDTIYGFYRALSDNEVSFKLKYPFFIFIALLTKFKLISNDELKRWGVRFYLKGNKREELERAGKEYAKSIEVNDIYRNDFQDFPKEQVIIISASFEEYLKPFFPGCSVVGSQMAYSEDGTCTGLKRNMYGSAKTKWLKDKGFEFVDIFFTDSFSDRPLMEISKNVYLVENGKKRLLNSGNYRKRDQS